jgi:phosphonoacetaldehyde hydrolase
MEECRKPMGLRKDLHIKSMLFDDTNVYRQWLEKYGRTPEQQDVDNLFKDFVPNAAELSGKNTVGLFRVQKKPLLNCHKRLGSTTGFTRSMVDILEKDANKQGVFFRLYGCGRRSSHRMASLSSYGVQKHGYFRHTKPQRHG